MVNAQKLQGSWNQIRGQIKEHWGVLTDDDLKIREGGLDQVIGRIQQKTGEARETIEHFLTELTDSGASMMSNVAQSVSNTAHLANERLREQLQQVADQAQMSYDQARRLMRDNPARSAAVVFGVGLAVGVLIGVAMSRR